MPRKGDTVLIGSLKRYGKKLQIRVAAYFSIPQKRKIEYRCNIIED